MQGLFSWFDNLINWFALFIPRRVIVRQTDKMIKFTWDGDAKEIEPGMRWYWPFTTDTQIVTVVRQPLDLPEIKFVTKDMVPCVADATVVYEISNVVAFVTMNFDGYICVAESVNAALRNKLASMNFADIQTSENLAGELTQIVQEDLEEFGVEIHYVRLQDFSYALPIALMGLEQNLKVRATL